MKLKFPKFKLPKFGKKEQDVALQALPVLTNLLSDALEKDKTPKPHPNAPLDGKPPVAKKIKRDKLWYVKLLICCGVAISPILIDAYPDSTVDDRIVEAIALVAGLLGVRHVTAKPAK